MKSKYNWLIVTILVTVSGFSQVETPDYKPSAAVDFKPKVTRFTNQLIPNEIPVALGLPNPKATTTFHWNTSKSVLEKSWPNDYEILLKKINDYQFNHYSCSATYADSKTLITDMIQDEITQYLIKQAFR